VKDLQIQFTTERFINTVHFNFFSVKQPSEVL